MSEKRLSECSSPSWFPNDWYGYGQPDERLVCFRHCCNICHFDITARPPDPADFAVYGLPKSTIAAPRSAIISVGELVLPDVMHGMTDASITRSPSMPRTLSVGSTTALSSSARPILQVPTG